MKKIIFGLALILGFFANQVQIVFASEIDESVPYTVNFEGIEIAGKGYLYPFEEYRAGYDFYVSGYYDDSDKDETFDSLVFKVRDWDGAVYNVGCYSSNPNLSYSCFFEHDSVYSKYNLPSTSFREYTLTYDLEKGYGSWNNDFTSNTAIYFDAYSHYFGLGVVYSTAVLHWCSKRGDSYEAYEGTNIDLNSIFFRKAPTPKMSLLKTVESVGLAGTMKQVVRMIPIVIVVSVGYLGLRKALTILRKVLFQA